MVAGFTIVALIVAIGAFLLPPVRFDPYAHNLIILIGVVGIWRYGWFVLNQIRAHIYIRHRFRKLRSAEIAAGKEIDPEHVFILITTFRIGTHVSVDVYRAAIQEAIESGYDVTIIASIVEMSEEKLVRKIFLSFDPPERVKLVIAREKGTGKRDGLSLGFRIVANAPYDLRRCVVAVVDGDSILAPGTLRKCARLFGLDEELGALTTDEDAILYGDSSAVKIYRRWYKLRFAQRNVTMASMALSERVLTLTGRMSMIRADIVAQRGFIETVQRDYIEHWRLGRFGFLTGDDKSSWYYVMKHGYKMLYVPDVLIYTVEEIPNPNWFKGSIELMRRWFGNQYRTNARALKIPVTKLGFFTWYALYDQRFTRWTSLYGLLIGIFGAVHWGIEIFFAYLWWILLTRMLMVFAYRLSREEIMPSWIFFLYYNQIVGSLVKIYVWHHLYKQKWTRQKTTLSLDDAFVQRYYRLSSNGTFAIEILLLILTTNFLVGNINFTYDVWSMINLLKGMV